MQKLQQVSIKLLPALAGRTGHWRTVCNNFLSNLIYYSISKNLKQFSEIYLDMENPVIPIFNKKNGKDSQNVVHSVLLPIPCIYFPERNDRTEFFNLLVKNIAIISIRSSEPRKTLHPQCSKNTPGRNDPSVPPI
jgi:hypothetical protein